MSASLFARRTRWQAVSRRGPDPVLRVGLLASYTVDPLVPYLGLALHDAGLPAALAVGPFGQIVQQCLAEEGFPATDRPDVLLVAPRLEEAGPDTVGWTDELLAAAEAAHAAARRVGALLVYVLPAVPEARPCGAGDPVDADGVTAAATAARERLRGRLAADPGVLLVDAEEAVRTVGTRRAYHPALFQLARVPYTEEVFAVLGAATARLLARWYGVGCRAVVLDVDAVGDPAPLLPALRELRAAGLRVAARASGWAALADPQLLSLLDGWVVDDRPPAAQLAEVAAGLDLVPAHLVLVTTATGTGPSGGTATAPSTETGPSGEAPGDGGPTLVLGADPRAWGDELAAAGLTDRLPARRWTGDARGGPPAAGPVGLSLADFLSSLDVRVEYRPVTDADVPQVAELVARAHDFALRPAPSAAELAARRADLLAVRVRDRLGDYGTGGLVAVTREAQRWTVDLFSLSCPVLGKGVERAVLGELARRAGAAGADELLVPWTDTGRNGSARRFLADLDPAAESVPVRVVRADAGATR